MELAADPQERRQAPDGLDEADQPERSEVAQEFVGLALEAGAADGRDLQPRTKPSKRLGQARAVKVAGGVSGHQEHAIRHSLVPRTVLAAVRAISCAQLGMNERVRLCSESS